MLRQIGVQVRRLRLERGLSQERLAERSGLKDYKYIGQVELSKTEPGADMLIRLARGLDVPVGELFDTITPMDSVAYRRLSPTDVQAIAAALKTLTTIVDRMLAGQPPPVPRRAPRQSIR